MLEEWCYVFDPGESILGEFVGELSVAGMFVFNVELVVEFFEEGGYFARQKSFILL